MKWMLVSVALLGTISCKKAENEKTPDVKVAPRKEAREAAQLSSEQRREEAEMNEKLKSGVSLQETTGPLAGVDERTITGDLKKLIESSTLKPNSESAKKAQEALAELLRRKSPEFYTMLSLLPPGWYSEMIVKGLFMEAELGLEEFREVMAKIKEPDLLKAALNGASFNGGKWKVGIAELEGFEKLGLSDEGTAMFLSNGYKAGLYSLDDLARNSNDRGNLLLSRLRSQLTSDQLKDYALLVYKNGRKFDNVSLFSLGLGMVDSGPEAGVVWARKLPQDAGKKVVDGIFSEWMKADPRAASKYLAQMDDGILKDSSTLALVRDCVRHDGSEDAANWAAQIKDEKIRAEAQELIEKGPPRE